LVLWWVIMTWQSYYFSYTYVHTPIKWSRSTLLCASHFVHATQLSAEGSFISSRHLPHCSMSGWLHFTSSYSC
jgi:hypothetical protein